MTPEQLAATEEYAHARVAIGDTATAQILLLVKALREARAEVERLREAARQVHALVSGEMEWTIERIDYPIQEIHKITKGMVE